MANRPNLLWIVLEDVSPRFGCYGDTLARTPNVDGLAADGRVYENAFCSAGVCAPSRTSMMTGRYPPALGAHHMRTTHRAGAACDAALDAELPTGYEAVPPHYVTAVSEHLRNAGYYATLDSKTDYQFGEPFTMWDHHGDGAAWWDANRDPVQPFFAVMTNDVTHESGMWPTDDAGNTSPETDPQAVDVPPYLPKPNRRGGRSLATTTTSNGRTPGSASCSIDLPPTATSTPRSSFSALITGRGSPGRNAGPTTPAPTSR